MRNALALAVMITTAACASRVARDGAIDYMALYYAAESENVVLVRALLARGAPVDAPDIDSAGRLSQEAVNFDSPLQVAARRGSVEIVRALLKYHPWVDHRCCDSPAALGYAAQGGYAEIVQMLLEAGADPSIKTTYDDGLEGTPVDAARRNGHTDVVQLLENVVSNMKGKVSPN